VYVPLLVKQTSYPVGGATVTTPNKLVPVTVNACGVEAVPDDAVKAAKAVGVAVITG
jgi:hypothetical protein